MNTNFLFLLLTLGLLSGCSSGGYSPSYIISDSIVEDPVKTDPQEEHNQAR